MENGVKIYAVPIVLKDRNVTLLMVPVYMDVKM